MSAIVERTKVKELLVEAGADGLSPDQVIEALGVDLTDLDKKEKKRVLQNVRAACRGIVKELGGRSVRADATDEKSKAFAKTTYIVDGTASSGE